MKKKKLLKRIEELERYNNQLEDKYKRVLFEDDKLAIIMMRQLYNNDKNYEQLLLKGLCSGLSKKVIVKNTVNAFIERGNDGTYGVYIDLQDTTLNYGIYGEGNTVEEAINNFNTSYTEMKKFYAKKGIDFVEAKFEFIYDKIHTNTFTPLTNQIYHPDPILFNKYCKECKLKKELTTAFNIISLDDNIFDIKSRPKIEVKIFSNLVQRYEK